ncbi:MAG TPA: hypothetical protein VM621_10535 [Luteibacter sp.]|uniref:hypothetical protein n=1 Tax=Luteibacter sp. TaxID=1886636 RepID=UPI002B565FF7|nr:hypothetical protein [Luteibacter sp.]HVI55474.1 hypothetical protein [Luteibacter sp.]
MRFQMHQRFLSLLLLLTLPVLSCCATGPVQTDGCDWAKPIYVSKDDVLTDGTAKQILTHDETGKVICGWVKYKPEESK